CYCSKRHRKINFYRGDNVGGSKDLRMSNLKGILIFLVVFGHFIEIYKKEYYELFVFIYAFHMPVFIFISGYFAKRMRKSKIINLILLYLIFQTFLNVILFLTDDTPFQFTYGEPHFHLRSEERRVGKEFRSKCSR